MRKRDQVFKPHTLPTRIPVESMVGVVKMDVFPVLTVMLSWKYIVTESPIVLS